MIAPPIGSKFKLTPEGEWVRLVALAHSCKCPKMAKERMNELAGSQLRLAGKD